ncbi:MAG: DNA-binding protein Alba [Archaeoglobi archaeon]|nr:DNA-binding protein Alba [Candidatus Mnemosynella sp.]
MAEENVIFVGNKPIMNYVLAVITQFNSGAKNVVLKARGRAISRAVDVAEIVRKKFLTDVEVKDIKIDTEEISGEGGDTVNVSSIEIYLAK